MPNPYFKFKQFTIYHDRCAMKVTTDACLFGAWTAEAIGDEQVAGSNERRLLDVGTGSGLLTLMVAQKNAGMIDAVEIDPAAAVQAAENASASPWQERIRVINENLLHWQTDTLYDVIFSNPPFYENEIRSVKSEKNRAHHDESLTLDALFRFVRTHLKKEGRFFLLLPAKRKTPIENLLKKHHLFAEQMVQVQQTLKHPPFRLMIQGRLQNVDTCKESFLAIKDHNDAYTPAFVQLLRPYYLYL